MTAYGALSATSTRTLPSISIVRFSSCLDWRDEGHAARASLITLGHLDPRRQMAHHRLRQSETLKRGEDSNEQTSRPGPSRARKGAGALDHARGRRDRADAASHPAGGFRPDRERALSLAAAAKHRWRRGSAGSLHANAGGDRK